MRYVCPSVFRSRPLAECSDVAWMQMDAEALYETHFFDDAKQMLSTTKHPLGCPTYHIIHRSALNSAALDSFVEASWRVAMSAAGRRAHALVVLGARQGDGRRTSRRAPTTGWTNKEVPAVLDVFRKRTDEGGCMNHIVWGICRTVTVF